MTDSTATATAIAKLSEAGKHFMTLVGELHFDHFDMGVVEGSGNWGIGLAEQAARPMGKAPKSISGIMGNLAKSGLWTVSEVPSEGKWWELTELGAAVARDLAADATSEPVEEPTVTEAVEHASVEAIDAAIEAGEASVKPLTRKELLALFAAKGYTGPTSYLLPKLREIAAGL